METLGSKVAGWLLTAGNDHDAEVIAAEHDAMYEALLALVELHYGCRHCGEHRPCREIVAIAEALNLIDSEA